MEARAAGELTARHTWGVGMSAAVAVLALGNDPLLGGAELAVSRWLLVIERARQNSANGVRVDVKPRPLRHSRSVNSMVCVHLRRSAANDFAFIGVAESISVRASNSPRIPGQ